MNDRRSLLNFAILIVMAAATAGFVANKASEAVAEIDALNIYPPFSGRQKTAVDTSDWKTYRNEKYGFEVMYPAEWVEGFKDPQYSQSIFTLVSPSTRKAIENNIPGAGDVDIAIRILDISSFEKLDEELKPQAFFITNKRRSVLNGYDAYFMTIGGAGAKVDVYFHRNGKLIALVFDTGATGELRPLEQQILSTFKFIK